MLLGSKGEFVDIDRVRFFVIVAVDLIIDRDSVPVPAGRSVIAVQSRSLAVQRNGFEQQMIIRGALHVDGQVVPGIADRIAGNTALYPVFARIVPSVPLMATSDPAFMTPNVGFAANELVDIELEGLRVVDFSDPEINVISKVMERWHEGLAEIRNYM